MRRLRNRDRGSIAPLVPIVLLALFFLGGVLVDGSRDLNIRGDAQAYAEEAARAGASAVDLRSATLKLDEGEARAMVGRYCAEIGKNPSVTVLSCGLDTSDGSSGFTDAVTCGVDAQIVVHTEVSLQIDTTLLGMFGPRKLTGTGHAEARPIEGTTAENAC